MIPSGAGPRLSRLSSPSLSASFSRLSQFRGEPPEHGLPPAPTNWPNDLIREQWVSINNPSPFCHFSVSVSGPFWLTPASRHSADCYTPSFRPASLLRAHFAPDVTSGRAFPSTIFVSSFPTPNGKRRASPKPDGDSPSRSTHRYPIDVIIGGN